MYFFLPREAICSGAFRLIERGSGGLLDILKSGEGSGSALTPACGSELLHLMGCWVISQELFGGPL